MSENGSIGHFVRQRRNLILVSLFIIFYKVADLEMKKINILGNEVSVGNPAIVSSALSIFFVYFLWRYYTSCREIGGFSRFLAACRTWTEKKCTDYIRKKYFPRHQDNARRVDLISRGGGILTFRIYDDPDDPRVQGREVILRGRYWLMSTLSFIPVIFHTSYFSEYLLPYILGLVAVIELVNLGYVSNLTSVIGSSLSWVSASAGSVEPMSVATLDVQHSEAVSDCVYKFLGLCFVQPNSSDLGVSIFGFSEFVSALALLVIVYTLSDVRYKFRVLIAPIPLFMLTYFFIAVIGFGTLSIDVWSASQWLVLDVPISKTILQGILGFLFLSLVLTWVFYAFIFPPVFNKGNAKRFAHELIRIIMKGSEDEMPVIAHELGRSARSIVSISRVSPSRTRPNDEGRKERTVASDFAYEVLLMIGGRRLCRYIVSSSPMTAIEFFNAFSERIDKSLPVGQFARNISTEAILNTDSILYHEDEGYNSGWLGYVQPFSKAIYGDYDLIETLSHDHSSPLHLSHEVSWDFSVVQFKAYTRVVLIAFEAYVQKYKRGDVHSYALYNSFETIGHVAQGIYKIDGLQNVYSNEAAKKFDIAVHFVSDCVRFLNKHGEVPDRLATEDHNNDKDIYDRLANLMFEIILAASGVKTPSDTAWWVHHNMVWSDFFVHIGNGNAQKIIHHRLRRLLYDEICQLSDLPNFKSARALGICLNVLGPVIHKTSYKQEQLALHKVMLAWLKKNYLSLRDRQYKVADACIIGSITYDPELKRIVKTYNEGLNLVAHKDYLDLAPVIEPVS